MKQHITVKQLKELSKKGKEKLMDRFVDADIRLLHSIFPKEKTQSDRKFLKSTIEEERLLLSIGEMIEFLEEKFNGIIKTSDEKQFIVSIKTSPHPIKQFYSFELCDALWEAVKEVLEK